MKVEHPTHAGSRPEYPSRATAAGFALAACLLGSMAQAQNTATPPVPGQPAPASGKPDSAEQQRRVEENRQLIETARKVLDGNLSRKGGSSAVETAGECCVLVGNLTLRLPILRITVRTSRRSSVRFVFWEDKSRTLSPKRILSMNNGSRNAPGKWSR